MPPISVPRAAAIALLLLATGCMELVYKVPVTVSDLNLRTEAAKGKPVAWKLPLGAGRIGDMAFHAPGRLLVSLRKDQSVAGDQYAMMVDTATGRPLWRYEPMDRKGEYSRILTTGNLILYSFNRTGNKTLVAVSSTDGTESWATPEIPGPVVFQPILGQGVMLATQSGEKTATITAYDLGSGAMRWERQFSRSGESAAPPAPMTALDALWTFFGAAEKLSARDGKTVWRRDDIRLGGTGPAPQLAGNSLYLTDAGGQVHRLAADTGKTVWTMTPPAGVTATNLFPLNDRVYLRGIDAKSKRYPFIAMDRQTGRMLWHRITREPIVSNLLEYKGRVFFATPTGVGSRDQASGKRYFERTITNSGRTYPVHLKRFGDKVIFIGELIVAAVDAESGKLRYSHGLDPVELGASMTSLDGRLEKLLAKQAAASGEAPSGALAMAEFHNGMSQSYQDMSSRYAKLSDDGVISTGAAMDQMKVNNQRARAEARMALAFSMQALGEELAKMIAAKALARTIVRQKFQRGAILAAYGGMEFGEYAYRPANDYRAADNKFITINVIHLPTGRIRKTSLSAPHSDFGLWNLIDFERGVVYHNGVGLDPADYQYSGQTSIFDGAEYLNSFLIAQPVTIPR